MKKTVLIIISFAVTVLLPLLICYVLRVGGGMAFMWILWYLVNPLWHAALGAISGRDVKKSWYLPLVSAAIFLAGAMMLFPGNGKHFAVFAACYAGIGMLAALISARLKAWIGKPAKKEE